MLLLYYYVPETALNSVNEALFATGLGKFADKYDRCCWYAQGTGQFRPLAGSNAHIGTINTIEKVPEYKVEIICPIELKQAAISALFEAHPYEIPVYGFMPFIID